MTADAFFRDPGRVYRPGKQCCPSPARASVHLLIELIEGCLYLLIIVGIMFVVAFIEHSQNGLAISKVRWMGFHTLTIAEKNRLWKLVMQKATVYRSPDNELTVNIYPNLPK